MTEKWRKKPVVVEAMRWPRVTSHELPIEAKVAPIREWVGAAMDDCWRDGLLIGRITTLEGVMLAQPGDWIIRGVQGEFYPCKPDIFAATYEPAVGSPAGDPLRAALEMLVDFHAADLASADFEKKYGRDMSLDDVVAAARAALAAVPSPTSPEVTASGGSASSAGQEPLRAALEEILTTLHGVIAPDADPPSWADVIRVPADAWLTMRRIAQAALAQAPRAPEPLTDREFTLRLAKRLGWEAGFDPFSGSLEGVAVFIEELRAAQLGTDAAPRAPAPSEAAIEAAVDTYLLSLAEIVGHRAVTRKDRRELFDAAIRAAYAVQFGVSPVAGKETPT